MNKKCSAQVSMHTNFPRWRQCNRNATVIRNGEHFCKIHDPIEVNKRRDKIEKRQAEKSKLAGKLEYARIVLKQKEERKNELCNKSKN